MSVARERGRGPHQRPAVPSQLPRPSSFPGGKTAGLSCVCPNAMPVDFNSKVSEINGKSSFINLNILSSVNRPTFKHQDKRAQIYFIFLLQKMKCVTCFKRPGTYNFRKFLVLSAEPQTTCPFGILTHKTWDHKDRAVFKGSAL